MSFEEEVNPTDLITADDVLKALQKEKGDSVTLDSFKIENFTQKGDNYACVVSSVEVHYKKYGKSYETSYVVKLNPMRKTDIFEKMTDIVFVKESGFYRQIIPMLNEELSKINEKRIKAPKHYHSAEEPGKQAIYLEDLRKSGFKMSDRKIGMDKNHTNLVLRELGKLHASSVIFLSKFSSTNNEVERKFPVLEEGLFKKMDDLQFNFLEMYKGGLVNAIGLLDDIDGYQFAIDFLKEESEKVADTMIGLMECSEPFRVICHGDCWNNNMLFKYNDEGVPVDCRLLDFQINRIGSPALDLNYLLFSSLTGQTREENMDDFFTTYYSSFASVLSSAKKPIPFTLEELKREYMNKLKFGIFVSVNIIPALLMASEDVFDLNDLTTDEDEMAKLMEEYQKKTKTLMVTNQAFKPRFLSVFDEMKKLGTTSKNSVDRLIKTFNSLSS